jgi:hypothetical protein
VAPLSDASLECMLDTLPIYLTHTHTHTCTHVHMHASAGQISNSAEDNLCGQYSATELQDFSVRYDASVTSMPMK